MAKLDNPELPISKPPEKGYGYIYILSNVSFDINIYKIGLTTNSVKQRISELNTTGVPTPYKAEKIFHIEERYLASVERSAHKKLIKNDLHHGKEFFKAEISVCVEAVQDAIYEIIGTNSIELVGQAIERDIKNKFESTERDKERARKEQQVRKANEDIEQKRQQYIRQQEIDRNASTPFLDKFVWEPIALIVIAAIALAIAIATGPIGWIACPIVIYFIYSNDKNKTNQRYKNSAEIRYPYRTIENINSYQDQVKTKTSSHLNINSLPTNRREKNQSIQDEPSITCPACKHQTRLFEKDRYQNCLVCRHKFTNPYWKPERPLVNLNSKTEIIWIKTPRGLRNKKTNEFIFFSETLRSVFPTPGYSIKSDPFFIKDSEMEVGIE